MKTSPRRRTGRNLSPPKAELVEVQAAELEDHLRRALADLDNLRKRFDREVTRERATESAASLWLPIVDDLERALEHAEADAESIVQGVRAVREQALRTLEQLGYRRFDDIGELFDPLRDEAVSAIDVDAPAGTVVATVRPGYGTDGNILRPASVVVSRGAGGGWLTRGTSRGARDPAGRHGRGHPAGLPEARPDLPPGHEQGPVGGGDVQGDRRGLRRVVRSGHP